jgi:hypothetical protein
VVKGITGAGVLVAAGANVAVALGGSTANLGWTSSIIPMTNNTKAAGKKMTRRMRRLFFIVFPAMA